MAPLNQVIERADRVLIVASGPSAENLDLSLVARAREAGVYVLAVNRSWEWCRDVDGWFTLDPDRNVIRFLFNKSNITRYVAVPDDYGQEDARVVYHRNKPFYPGVIYLRRLSGNGIMGSRDGLSADSHCIHTGNSAYGALGVAWHMGATRIGLIGVDANRCLGYANRPGCPRTMLNHLPKLFKSAKPQLDEQGIEVRNGSPSSRVKCFPRYHPNAVVEWLISHNV